MQLFQQLIQLVAHIVVTARRRDLSEIAMQCPDIRVNRHIVVIEDYKQIIGGIGRVVESFEGQPSGN